MCCCFSSHFVYICKISFYIVMISFWIRNKQCHQHQRIHIEIGRFFYRKIQRINYVQLNENNWWKKSEYAKKPRNKKYKLFLEKGELIVNSSTHFVYNIQSQLEIIEKKINNQFDKEKKEKDKTNTFIRRTWIIFRQAKNSMGCIS